MRGDLAARTGSPRLVYVEDPVLEVFRDGRLDRQDRRLPPHNPHVPLPFCIEGQAQVALGGHQQPGGTPRGLRRLDDARQRQLRAARNPQAHGFVTSVPFERTILGLGPFCLPLHRLGLLIDAAHCRGCLLGGRHSAAGLLPAVPYLVLQPPAFLLGAPEVG